MGIANSAPYPQIYRHDLYGDHKLCAAYEDSYYGPVTNLEEYELLTRARSTKSFKAILSDQELDFISSDPVVQRLLGHKACYCYRKLATQACQDWIAEVRDDNLDIRLQTEQFPNDLLAELLEGQVSLKNRMLLTDCANTESVEARYKLPITGYGPALIFHWDFYHFSPHTLQYWPPDHCTFQALKYNNFAYFVQLFSRSNLNEGQKLDLLSQAITTGLPEFTDYLVARTEYQHFNFGQISTVLVRHYRTDLLMRIDPDRLSYTVNLMELAVQRQNLEALVYLSSVKYGTGSAIACLMEWKVFVKVEKYIRDQIFDNEYITEDARPQMIQHLLSNYRRSDNYVNLTIFVGPSDNLTRLLNDPEVDDNMWTQSLESYRRRSFRSDTSHYLTLAVLSSIRLIIRHPIDRPNTINKIIDIARHHNLPELIEHIVGRMMSNPAAILPKYVSDIYQALFSHPELNIQTYLYMAEVLACYQPQLLKSHLEHPFFVDSEVKRNIFLTMIQYRLYKIAREILKDPAIDSATIDHAVDKIPRRAPCVVSWGAHHPGIVYTGGILYALLGDPRATHVAVERVVELAILYMGPQHHSILRIFNRYGGKIRPEFRSNLALIHGPGTMLYKLCREN